jgi:hypothetical protein
MTARTLCEVSIEASHGSGHDIPGLERHWRYRPERMPISNYWRFARHFAQRKPAPASAVLRAPTPQPYWYVLFIYAPKGRLTDCQRFTLSALHHQNVPLCVVAACQNEDSIPADVFDFADALYWKDLPGYDFSAYSVALHGIAENSPGADVLVMNDSVFGPFTDLRPYLYDAPWDLTGMTGTFMSRQRHIQSYAFVLKAVTKTRLSAMGGIFSPAYAFDTASATISCRELWMARQAARSMSVGAYWYGGSDSEGDPSLSWAIDLVDAGFPFLKKSLLGKHGKFQPRGVVLDRLRRLGHPLTVR